MTPDLKSLLSGFTLGFLIAWGVFYLINKPLENPVQNPAGNQTANVQTAVTPEGMLISKMKMTFDEEFNSLSLYRDGAGNVTCGPNATGTWQTIYFGCTRTTASNNEAEVYLDQTPFHLADGVLSIEADPTDPYLQSALGSWAKYSSGMITTQYSFSQIYGYFEARIQVPAGRGLWPAFWLLPIDKSWPPEIDVMETLGDRNPVNGEGGRTLIHYASHLPPDNQMCGAWYDTKMDVTTGFHTYGVDWEPNAITYYFDGTPYATCPPNPAANKPFYILINLAVGGTDSWPGPPDPTTVWPAQMKIDYVRAYQKLQ